MASSMILGQARHACSRHHQNKVPGQAQIGLIIGVQEPSDVPFENLHVPRFSLVKKGYPDLSCTIVGIS